MELKDVKTANSSLRTDHGTQRRTMKMGGEKELVDRSPFSVRGD